MTVGELKERLKIFNDEYELEFNVLPHGPENNIMCEFFRTKMRSPTLLTIEIERKEQK